MGHLEILCVNWHKYAALAEHCPKHSVIKGLHCNGGVVDTFMSILFVLYKPLVPLNILYTNDVYKIFEVSLSNLCVPSVFQ